MISAGEITRGRHSVCFRVYTEDTDATGVVYHANYLRFLERGRSDFLRCLGINLSEPLSRTDADHGYYAVTAVEMRFLSPARLDDILKVSTRVDKLGGASCRLQQTVERVAMAEPLRPLETIVDAMVTVAYLGAGGRPRRQPAAWRASFDALLDAAQTSTD
ncbi:MAG: YbgC/FadM family acyl-CoA thioesterase [Sphingomonadales bacterium]|nr:MAG: YbgC/FadM family acyl-CoA thioesterase [Sphingomonadales bacterium]